MRPPRAVESTEMILEREFLQSKVRALQDEIRRLNIEIGDLAIRCKQSVLETEHLLHHKILLGRELASARAQIDFLTGRLA
jgi:uncharacterized protein YydD (DUF2326 family)